MEAIKEDLSQVIGKHLSWHKARIECFYLLILSVLQSSSVQLPALSHRFESGALPASRVKRFYRLLREQVFDFSCIAKIIMALVGEQKKLTLTLDRTN